MRAELISIFPELVLSVSAMILLMMGVYSKQKNGQLITIAKSASFALLMGLGAIIFLQKNIQNSLLLLLDFTLKMKPVFNWTPF